MRAWRRTASPRRVQRRQLIESGKIKPLPAASEAAADRCYVETATKLCDGLEAVLKKYENAGDQQ